MPNTTAQLLNLADLDTLTIDQRKQIITEIDQRIAYYQQCQKVLLRHGLHYDQLTLDIVALRKKKVEAYLSFYPKIRTKIRLDA